MAFTAKDVQALRQATGAGMMDAKRALEANDGDMETAAQWLREKCEENHELGFCLLKHLLKVIAGAVWPTPGATTKAPSAVAENVPDTGFALTSIQRTPASSDSTARSRRSTAAMCGEIPSV